MPGHACRCGNNDPEIMDGTWSIDANKRDLHVVYVACEQCGRGVHALTEEEAIEFWNLVNG